MSSHEFVKRICPITGDLELDVKDRNSETKNRRQRIIQKETIDSFWGDDSASPEAYYRARYINQMYRNG